VERFMSILRSASLAIAAAGAFALLPASAHADAYRTGRVAPAAFSWTGFYFGGQGGGAWTEADWTHLSAVPHFNPVGTNVDSFEMESGIGGGHIGFNLQHGQWVFGIEGAFNWADLEDTHVRPGTFSDNTITTRLRDLLTVTGRVGWAWDRSLVYVRGGYAGSDLSMRATEAPFFAHTFSDSSWVNGWTVGAGAEFAVHSNVTLGVAYDYIDLQSKTFSGLDSSSFAVATIRVDPDPIHAVTGRLSFKFGSERVYAPLK
jgi:outer membrane immunogenic protein